MRRIFFVFLLILVLVVGSSSAQTDSMPGLADLEDGWNVLVPGGETMCSAGTPYQFYVRAVEDSSNLMIFFNGGGACWFGQACDLETEPIIHFPFAEMPENDPRIGSGVFDLENEENPFVDYNMVFLPYCTGDVHIGAGPRDYTFTGSDGQEKTVTTYHNGFANVSSVLDWTYANFEAPESVLITGSSAGALGSSFYMGMVAEHYSEADVIHVGDGAGGYNSVNLPVVFNAWGTADILPDWEEYAGETAETLTFEDFYIANANHVDNLTIGQYNTAYDEVQVSFTLVLGDAPDSFDLPSRILNNQLDIESGAGDFYTYLAGGSVHTILRSPEFYTYSVEDMPFVDWMGALAAGESVEDISCVDTAAGCTPAPDGAGE